jgi:hypothetical protein
MGTGIYCRLYERVKNASLPSIGERHGVKKLSAVRCGDKIDLYRSPAN